ncbi:hypothetical protein CHELA20_51494 [Hyphomicrobiales bacterium]|nr:hypothetical protein CHELA41_23522 [Hyphomicrobiales bacterium]CAH1676454.1 hypothetical protein CHELA20_51494 [Hyphomicrobiales bacterium]
MAAPDNVQEAAPSKGTAYHRAPIERLAIRTVQGSHPLPVSRRIMRGGTTARRRENAFPPMRTFPAPHRRPARATILSSRCERVLSGARLGRNRAAISIVYGGRSQRP